MSTAIQRAVLLAAFTGSASRLVSETRPDLSTNLYYRSLNACLDARSERMKAAETLRDSNPVFVLEDQRIMPLFPSSVGAFRVEYLGKDALKRQYSRLRAQYPVVGIEPMNNAGSVLIVRCGEYSVGVRRGRVILGVMGGWDVQWEYDCLENKYSIVNVKRWWVQM